MDKNNVLKTILVAIIFILGIVVLVWKKPNIGDNYKPSKEPVSNRETDFNLKLFKTVNSTNDNNNYLISPYSIEIALNLLATGANGDTYKEINDVIGNRKIADVTSSKVKVANAIFIKNKYKNYIETEFYDTLVDRYKSEVLYDNFKSPKVINDWVNRNTDGMINKILDNIDPDFVLGLANALAIDVEWYSEFECNNTSKSEFTKADNNKINVEMMHKTYYSHAKYLDNDSEIGIVLPYREVDGKALEFIGILPNDNLNDYINNLTTDKLNEIENSIKTIGEDTKVNLSLPRFSYSYSLDNFMDVLKAMGIKKVFSSSEADLSKMIAKDNWSELGIINLYVSDAIHKTYIELNEKGTKAAAVTYFGVKNESAMLPKEEKIIEINFNHPFMYIIRDTESKELLFLGTVYEPNAWKGSTCKDK